MNPKGGLSEEGSLVPRATGEGGLKSGEKLSTGASATPGPAGHVSESPCLGKRRAMPG